MRTLTVPLVYRIPGSFPSVLHRSDLGKARSCDAEHLENVSVASCVSLRGKRGSYTEHDSVRNEGFKRDTHR